MASICQDYLASVHGPPQQTAGRENEGGTSSDMAHSLPCFRNGRQSYSRAHGAFAAGLTGAEANSGVSAGSGTAATTGWAQSSGLTGATQVFTQPGRTADLVATSTILPPTFLESKYSWPDITLPSLGKPPNFVAGKGTVPHGWCKVGIWCKVDP